MDKGIIIGAEHETATRSNLSFVMFRHTTGVRVLFSFQRVIKSERAICQQSHLFLHHILRFLLGDRQVKEAVAFASHYQNLIFFAHALEILLHTVVESEATLESEDTMENGKASDGISDGVLPTLVQFLDHFDVALDVVVGCARKTELTRWRRLFSIVGNPKSLFEVRVMPRSCPYTMESQRYLQDVPSFTATQDRRILPPCST